jgi:hypothetical protein
MTTTQRVLGFAAGLVAVFAVGLGLGQLVDLEQPAPAHQTPRPEPTEPTEPTEHGGMEMPDVHE